MVARLRNWNRPYSSYFYEIREKNGRLTRRARGKKRKRLGWVKKFLSGRKPRELQRLKSVFVAAGGMTKQWNFRTVKFKHVRCKKRKRRNQGLTVIEKYYYWEFISNTTNISILKTQLLEKFKYQMIQLYST